MKKIYYFANIRMPTEKAHGIQLAKMCEAFVSNGAFLELIVPMKKNTLKMSVKEYYGLDKDIVIRKLWVLPGIFGFNMQALSFALSSFLYSIIRVGTDDVVYTIDMDQFSFFSLVFRGRPVFIEVHGSKKNSFFIRFFMKKVRGIITVSEQVKKRMMMDFSVSSPKIIVETNAVDPRIFKVKRTDIAFAPVADGRSACMYYGRFYDWKGLRTMVDGAAKLVSECVFYCVGGTKEELMKATSLESLPSNLYCIDAVAFSEGPHYLSKADILVVTGTHKNTYSSEETSPMKLFEYMCAEKPILAARTRALTDVVTDNEVWFYEADDSENFVNTVRELLSQKKKRDVKVENARTYIASKTWLTRAAHILEFIKTNI